MSSLDASYYLLNDDLVRIDIPKSGVVGREEVRLAYPSAPETELKKISGSSFRLTLSEDNEDELLLTRMSRNPIYVNDRYLKEGSLELSTNDRVKFGISTEETGYALVLRRDERVEEAVVVEKGGSEDAMDVDKAQEDDERSPSLGPTKTAETPPEPEIHAPKEHSTGSHTSCPTAQTELDRLAAAERAIKPPSSIEGSVADDYAEAADEREKTSDEEEEREAAEAGEFVTSESDVLGFSTDEDNMDEELWRNREKMRKERKDKMRIAELKAMPLKRPKAERKPKKRPAAERSSSPAGSDEEGDEEPKSKKLRGPKTAYGRFAARERPKMKRRFPEESNEEITKLLRVKWKEIQEGKVAKDGEDDGEEGSDEE
jgi:hypothetical protein